MIEFESAAYGDDEATGGNLPRLRVNGRIPVGGLTIDLVNIGGTATAATDFALNPTFTIPAGDYDGQSTIDISSIFSINDESLGESDETVILQLTNPQAPLQVNDANCDGIVTDMTTYTIIDDDVVLEEGLAEFKAETIQGINYLYWISKIERQQAYYIVEYSNNCLDWKAIGRVNSLGDDDVPQDYQFKHNYPKVESYYRLKIVDVYGEYTYSNVLYLKSLDALNSTVNIYPNPVGVGNLLIIKFAEELQLASLKFYDLQGQLVKAEVLDNASTRVLEVDMSNLTNGIYILYIELTNGITITEEIVKH